MAQGSESPAGRSRDQEEVVGLVHPRGAGGGRGGQETLWTLRFTFAAWRRPGDGVEDRPLPVFKPNLSDPELQGMMALIEPYHILRVRLRFTNPSGGAHDLQGELDTVVGEEPGDDELNARADRLREPVTVDHPYFGTATLDRDLNSYEVTFPWGSRPVELCLSRDGCEDEHELFGTAQRLWEQQQRWDERVRDYATEKLLDLKNDAWLGEDEKEFTPTGFRAQMTLQSIAVYPGGLFEFIYDDGGLFWGHVILVSGNLLVGPTDASIAG